MDNYDQNNGYGQDPLNEQKPYDPNSGYQQQYYDPNGGIQPEGDGGKGMATASMILGIVAIVGACCCTFVGIICGVLAVIFGVMSKKKGGEGANMATAGIICGAIGAALGVITTIINVVNMANGNNPLQDFIDQLSSSGMFLM